MTKTIIPARSAVEAAAAETGALPEWNLADLYPAMDSPELSADLEKSREKARSFQDRWRGRLASETAAPDGRLVEAIREYEELEELLGRVISYAGLVYSGDTSDPARAKFYGDIQSSVTDIASKLLFFALELNRIEDGVMDAAMDRDPALGHYRPWLVDLRKDKPFQLEDRVEELFHDKTVTGAGAWNRLFDETLTSFRCSWVGEVMAL